MTNFTVRSASRKHVVGRAQEAVERLTIDGPVARRRLLDLVVAAVRPLPRMLDDAGADQFGSM